MRIGSAAAALVVAAIVGCGGKVVVDGGDAAGGGGSGAGGAGSTSSGTTTTTTSVTTSGFPMCGAMSCSGASDGSCQCDGVCDAQKLEVVCAPIMGGASCTCIENGIKIAVCVQPGAATCSFVDECCGPQFFGQAGGG